MSDANRFVGDDASGWAFVPAIPIRRTENGLSLRPIATEHFRWHGGRLQQLWAFHLKPATTHSWEWIDVPGGGPAGTVIVP